MNKNKRLKTLYSKSSLQRMIKSLARRIVKDYKNRKDNKSLVVISVLKGAFIFTADLIREIKLPVQLEFVKISSYGSGTASGGRLDAPLLLLPDLKGRDILIVEDIVDSGRTVSFLKEYIRDQYKPKSLKVACLLNKEARREVDIKPDYIGFEVDDCFLVGYGLDSAENYRHLPFLAVIE